MPDGLRRSLARVRSPLPARRGGGSRKSEFLRLENLGEKQRQKARSFPDCKAAKLTGFARGSIRRSA
jgi:hypothetical protein